MKERHTHMIERKERNITLSEIGKAIGVSVSALSQHEKGVSRLKDENYRKYIYYINNNDNRR
ncbi:helix-turn-helix domain-containing protein [Salibacterium qingdaonense]|uniref:Helix-turn-helix n=1 Tax=Salibacterium qingdaonense TaxID=266892 RepID=A0A1I4QMI3_9BACI|nr:helix-turn-helix transcriptional regulator [Salibacterium qingdaonense]SFM41251.1 Helix-turn-helix [Salibacterium qingdaonense]